VDTNFKGTVYALKHQLPAIGKYSTDQQWGVILNTSSGAGQRPNHFASVYSATKAAVDSLSLSASREGELLKVRVNSIAPGATLTQGALALFSMLPPGDLPKMSINKPTLPEDIAQFVLFVASNDTGHFFNGAVLLQDG
jgi:3-oxoacyl-[acyl-carrier protein] reductase